MKLYIIAFILGYCAAELFGVIPTVHFFLWCWVLVATDDIIRGANLWTFG